MFQCLGLTVVGKQTQFLPASNKPISALPTTHANTIKLIMMEFMIITPLDWVF
jgi:hypothetical protein